MDTTEYVIRLVVTIAALGISFFLTFIMCLKAIIKYTDIGKKTKKDKEKRNKAFNGPDDIPAVGNYEPFAQGKPRIETSFGDGRIGSTHEYPKED